MAVLNSIRRRGIFLIIVIAMALFAFILADLFRQNGFGSENQTTIAKINGKEISRFDFSNRIQAVQQNSFGNLSTLQAVNRVWDATVEQTLMEEQMENLGIEIGNQQLASALAIQFGHDPNFQTNGDFDIGKFKGYIDQLRAISPETYQQWVMNEKDIADQARAEIYMDLLKAGLGMTTADAKELYKLNNTTFNLQYVKIPYSNISNDEISISDSEIKSYINSHKKDFTSKGTRDIRYVLFEETATGEDVESIKESLAGLLNDHTIFNKAAGMDEPVKGFKNVTDLSEYLSEYSDLPYTEAYSYKKDLAKSFADTLYNLNKGDVYGPYEENGYWKYTRMVDHKQMPDSVDVSHILITYNGVPSGLDIDRTHAEAEQLADSLVSMLKDDSDKFADLAKEYSDDPGSSEEGGELGWNTYPKGNQNDLIEYMFNNEEGSIGVVEGQYGFHVVKINEVRNLQKVVKLATLAKKIEPSDATLTDLFNKATTFQIDAQGGDFEAIAENDGYEVRTIKNLGALDENLSGLGAQRGIVQWAFEKETKVGKISRFETDRGQVVAQVTSKTSEGLQSVEEARDQVTAILMNKKKAEKIMSQISETDMNEIASSFGTQVRTKMDVDMESPDLEGNEPRVVGTAFALSEGDVSKPIEGKNAVYVIKVLKKTEADDLGSYNGIKHQENEKVLQKASGKIFDALKDKAEIEDHRAKFY